jgi:tRNA U34 5-carboxymethylaminomethyl modifying enzyme MnmG/GidA
VQAIANPVALELSNELKKAVAPNEFVNETLNRRNQLIEFQEYVERQEQKAEQKTAEKMVISAIKNKFPFEAIETLSNEAGITKSRLDELVNQTKIG